MVARCRPELDEDADMARPRKTEVPTVEEVKEVLPNNPQPQVRQMPMNTARRMAMARANTGQGFKTGNLMGLNARPSKWPMEKVDA